MLSEPRDPAAGAVTMTVPTMGETECGWSLGLGGVHALACRWPFAYRAAEALTAFEDLNDAVAACAGEAALPQTGVNHPDSYDLRLYPLDGGVVAVSLKDKIALDESYIFLRIETRPD